MEEHFLRDVRQNLFKFDFVFSPFIILQLIMMLHFQEVYNTPTKLLIDDRSKHTYTLQCDAYLFETQQNNATFNTVWYKYYKLWS